jgi:hypothetical protein
MNYTFITIPYLHTYLLLLACYHLLKVINYRGKVEAMRNLYMLNFILKQ